MEEEVQKNNGAVGCREEVEENSGTVNRERVTSDVALDDVGRGC